MAGTARSPMLGIVSLMVGLGALATQDVIFKLMSGRYSVFEILFLRGCFTLLVLRFVLLALRFPRPLHTARLGTQYLRGGLLCTSLSCYCLALSAMPLLDVVAIFFSAPLMATALSPWLLGERVSAGQWGAVVVGFIGMLVMVGPGAGAFQSGAVFALFAAVFYACSSIASRSLGHTDRAATTAYYTVCMYIVVSALGVVAIEAAGVEWSAGEVVVARAWQEPDLFDLGLLAASGFAVSLGFFCLAQAYRHASIPVLAPFEYTSLIWAGLLGYFIWREVPSSSTLLGAVLIIASGWYVAAAPVKGLRRRPRAHGSRARLRKSTGPGSGERMKPSRS